MLCLWQKALEPGLARQCTISLTALIAKLSQARNRSCERLKSIRYAIKTTKGQPKLSFWDFTGAEGFEPTTHGFGDRYSTS